MKTNLASSNKALWIPRLFLLFACPIFFFTLSISLLAFDPAYYYSVQRQIGYEINQETRTLDEQLAKFFWSGKGADFLFGFQ